MIVIIFAFAIGSPMVLVQLGDMERCMATLSSYFVQALSKIEPDEDAANARIAHEEVRAALMASDPLVALGIDPVLIGSYKRKVSIRRVKDVDVFGRLTDATGELRPSRAMTLFEMALRDKFGEARVEPQHRSFKVAFPDFDLCVDAVPARPCGDHWEIPKKTDQDNRASWIETNPLKLNELTESTNSDYKINDKGVYVPTVKLIRQIRRTWVGSQPGGLFFELMTLQAFRDGKPEAASRAGYLVKTMNYIEDRLPVVQDDGLDDPTLPNRKIGTKATDGDFTIAISRWSEAAALARDALDEADDCKSALLWQRLLGVTSDGDHVFELPEYCAVDGTRKASAYVATGATVSPAGSGRYA